MDWDGHIDTTFDFRSDTPPGEDPDVQSPTLRRYHKRLWSKPLPSGAPFDLVDTSPRVYLHHKSPVGEFWLASDSVIPTFTRETRIAHITHQIPVEQRNTFNRIAYTIGGMMVFPGNRIANRMTINGARGFHPLIKDRFDLTVECIRRHYSNECSPLSDALTRYADFFRLFGDFRGYVEFFLLQDLVGEGGASVRFFLPFEDFKTSPIPGSVAEYIGYCRNAVDFIAARNRRILEACQGA
jgi:hypothetical protein